MLSEQRSDLLVGQQYTVAFKITLLGRIMLQHQLVRLASSRVKVESERHWYEDRAHTLPQKHRR